MEDQQKKKIHGIKIYLKKIKDMKVKIFLDFKYISRFWEFIIYF